MMQKITAEDRIIYLWCVFEKGIITEKLENILECFIHHLKDNWLCYAIGYVFKLNKTTLSCRTEAKSKINKITCDVCQRFVWKSRIESNNIKNKLSLSNTNISLTFQSIHSFINVNWSTWNRLFSDPTGQRRLTITNTDDRISRRMITMIIFGCRVCNILYLNSLKL